MPTLSWFYATLDENPFPLGTAANDNDRPMSVPDRNPLPQKAEAYLRALPPPTRVSLVSVRNDGTQVSPPRRVPHWKRPDGVQSTWGGFRIAERAKRGRQVVRVDGVDEVREFRVPAGSITHVWGERITQDKAKEREPEDAKSIEEADRSRAWFCRVLGATPGGKRSKTFKRRKQQRPIDWNEFAHVKGNVPFDDARAACDLPPADKLPKSLPWKPEPRRLFMGMLSGKGSRADGAGTPCTVKRPRDDIHDAGDHVVDRIALEQFEAREPEAYRLLLIAQTAGSMSDLVASNDNKTGKRAFQDAATKLLRFLEQEKSAA